MTVEESAEAGGLRINLSKRRAISVVFSEADLPMLDQIQSIANREKRSRSQVVREALGQYAQKFLPGREQSHSPRIYMDLRDIDYFAARLGSKSKAIEQLKQQGYKVRPKGEPFNDPFEEEYQRLRKAGASPSEAASRGFHRLPREKR